MKKVIVKLVKSYIEELDLITYSEVIYDLRKVKDISKEEYEEKIKKIQNGNK